MPRELELTLRERELAERVAGALWALSAVLLGALSAWASAPAFAG
jgi:hypothetical protein